jgi:hypothetical protein
MSTDATARWFSSLPASYYLLGFSYNGNHGFEAPLLRKLRPSAQVYIINLDLFFESDEGPVARTVMRDVNARTWHQQKRHWQYVHKPVCQSFPFVCGNAWAFFRARSTGSWVIAGPSPRAIPVSYEERVDPGVLRTYTAAGRGFLSSLPVRRECVILTMVPTVNTGGATPSTSAGTAKAVAHALGSPLVAPAVPGLNTFDASHLDQKSAQRWSDSFLEAASPQIRKCLDGPANTYAGGDGSGIAGPTL